MFKRPTAVALAAASLLAGASLTLAPSASAVPYVSGDRWVDCSGSTLCTIYWSRPKTAELYSNMQGPAWTIARAAVIANEVRASLGGSNKDQVTLDNIEDAAGTAVTYDGCLQYASRKDGGGKGQWSYTTHPDYCWNGPSEFQF